MTKAHRSPASSAGAPAAAPQVYMVGGRTASMPAAAFMIRDGDLFGQNITLLEESDKIGGSLDGAGSAEAGYVVRGGRMLKCPTISPHDAAGTPSSV